MDLTWGGRVVRVVVTLALGAGIVSGAVWGEDDDFPFGPFRMYATSRELDEPVGDTQVHAVDTAGREIRLVQELSGLRRAEIEGQLDRLRADPALLGLLAQSYSRRYPDRPQLRQIRVVVAWSELRDGKPTGEVLTGEVVEWVR